MEVYSLQKIIGEYAYFKVGYIRIGKSQCFEVNFEKLATNGNAKDKASAERIAAIIRQISRQKNFLARLTSKTVKKLSGIDNCYEIREKNIRIPFVIHNDEIIVLLCYVTKSKHGFDKKQETQIKKLAKEVNKTDKILFSEE
ncbi:MAG: type II toxin-antitoxin system RelE/ParE family toxin [Gammaproteobacteria bacterium]|nr:type II toxin-antitoxin system RelE/ParE family toxin [Gammaproteobacteria bacterium]